MLILSDIENNSKFIFIINVADKFCTISVINGMILLEKKCTKNVIKSNKILNVFMFCNFFFYICKIFEKQYFSIYIWS